MFLCCEDQQTLKTSLIVAAKPANMPNAKSFVILLFLVVVYIISLVRITDVFQLTGVSEEHRHLGLPCFIIFMSVQMFDTKVGRF